MERSHRLSVISQVCEDPFRERELFRRSRKVRAVDGEGGDQEIAVPEGQVEREKGSLREQADELLCGGFRILIWMTSKVENGFSLTTLWRCTMKRQHR